MSSSLAVLTEETGDDVTEMIGRLAGFVRGRRDGVPAEPNTTGVLGVLRAVQSEPQQRALDQLLVLGTLLEGHADHVMDAVGPWCRRWSPSDAGSTSAVRANNLRCNGCYAHCWASTRR